MFMRVREGGALLGRIILGLNFQPAGAAILIYTELSLRNDSFEIAGANVCKQIPGALLDVLSIHELSACARTTGAGGPSVR